MIYVITHKNFDFKFMKEGYKSLQVGAYKGHLNNIDFYDDVGSDNISRKNRNYCELTGLYWIWKNSSSNYVGISHYRRYFTFSPKFFPSKFILSEKKAIEILKNYDLILPKRGYNEYEGFTAKDQFSKRHDIKVWENCVDIISLKYPEYIESVRWFEKQKIGYCFNMLISNKLLYDEYCEWLFSILFDLENNFDFNGYNDDYNKRMPGFLSERLLNIWVHYNNLKVKEIPVFNTSL